MSIYSLSDDWRSVSAELPPQQHRASRVFPHTMRFAIQHCAVCDVGPGRRCDSWILVLRCRYCHRLVRAPRHCQPFFIDLNPMGQILHAHGAPRHLAPDDHQCLLCWVQDGRHPVPFPAYRTSWQWSGSNQAIGCWSWPVLLWLPPRCWSWPVLLLLWLHFADFWCLWWSW